MENKLLSSNVFLVIAGAIKSGKSMLINLLADRVVSTTKQEKEAKKFLKY